MDRDDMQMQKAVKTAKMLQIVAQCQGLQRMNCSKLEHEYLIYYATLCADVQSVALVHVITAGLFISIRSDK